MSIWRRQRPEQVNLVDTAAAVNTVMSMQDELANLTEKNSNCGSGALSTHGPANVPRHPQNERLPGDTATDSRHRTTRQLARPRW